MWSAGLANLVTHRRAPPRWSRHAPQSASYLTLLRGREGGELSVGVVRLWGCWGEFLGDVHILRKWMGRFISRGGSHLEEVNILPLLNMAAEVLKGDGLFWER